MAKKIKAPIIDSATAVRERNKLGLNQSQFWNKLGVTQSGGSRYEGGRKIPAPVKKLLYVVYLSGDVGDEKFAAIR